MERFPSDFGLMCQSAYYKVRKVDILREVPSFRRYLEVCPHYYTHEFIPGPIYPRQLAKLVDFFWTGSYAFTADEALQYPLRFSVDNCLCDGCNNWCRLLRAHFDMFLVARWLQMDQLQHKAMEAFQEALHGAPIKVVMWAIRCVYGSPYSAKRCDSNGERYSLGQIPDYRQHFVVPAILEHCQRPPTAGDPCQSMFDISALGNFQELLLLYPCLREDINCWISPASQVSSANFSFLA
ncbi:hypothetical protein N7468_007843 [Penicillium chermesinum]|uniref:BTB domain-containing protein n=1 Tax=Penicillium chermesinum TaxID=63820 RepID=A0A9W9NNX5_9EURO|nr:uncharacterized protein N7468_007843 [Penicillium chermesinum]KAJ5223301.1 hypothetical protein N7468_007843 [Penicillium chermesinum]KAJ6155858.1 hypothetical protein N7470_006424 [Penicillium chermesinum]